MKIVERQRAAAQEELTQDRDVRVGELQVSRLDHVDPRIGDEPRIVQREHDRVFHLNRRRGLQTAREVLLGGRAVDEPGLAVEVLRDRGGAFDCVVVLDADEAPLESGEAIVGRVWQLSVEGRLQHGHQRQQDSDKQHGHQPAARRKPDTTCGADVRSLRPQADLHRHGLASDNFSSRSWARS